MNNKQAFSHAHVHARSFLAWHILRGFPPACHVCVCPTGSRCPPPLFLLLPSINTSTYTHTHVQALAFAGVDASPSALKGHYISLAVILGAAYALTYCGLTLRARLFPPAY